MKRGGLVLLVSFLILLTVALTLSPSQPPITGTNDSFSTDFAYDNRTFLPAVAKFPPSNSPSPSVLVVPHHLLASNLIAEGMSSLANISPKTIVVLTPNHTDIGQCDIISSKKSWDTPYGQIEINQGLLDRFLSSRTVCLDDEYLKIEHGVAGLLPFIKFYLPDTKVVPLAFKKLPSSPIFQSFMQQLTTLSPEIVVIGSLDFSHGLSQKESLIKDEQTKSLIIKEDYDHLLELSSEHVDSPPVLVSIMRLINARGLTPSFTKHSDSSVFGVSPVNVTSYFVIKGSEISLEDSSFSILFGGDVMLGRTVNTRIHKNQDFTWPFRKISETLSSADLTVVNLESPFNANCPLTDSGMVFCANAGSVAGLTFAGIDAVSLANNHISNQGKEGFLFTQELLSKHKISFFGTGTPAIHEIKGTKIALIGFNDIPPHFSGISKLSEVSLRDEITKARSLADLVIVFVHWGAEYSAHNSRQTSLAKLAIDFGADAVIGHHPHWTQSFEEYKGKPIYYSLGNLVFDQMWSENTRKGQLVRFTYRGNELQNREVLLVKIHDFGQPVLE